MSKQLELQKIAEQIDRLAQAKGSSKDKTLAYQHKILQLLLQQKTTRLMNQSLGCQRDEAKKKTVDLQKTLQNETRRFKELEQTLTERLKLSNSEIELTKMKWLDVDEKNEELTCDITQIKAKMETCEQENRGLKEEVKKIKIMEEETKREGIRLREQNEQIKTELNQTKLDLKNKENRLKQTAKDLSEKENELREAKQHNSKIITQKQQLSVKSIDLTSLLETNKTLLIETQGELRQLKQQFDLQRDTLRCVERENSLLKDKKKELEADLQHFQNEKESLAGNSKKNEKQMKKMREELREALQKEKELQEEVSSCGEKIKNLEKNLKKSKRQVQQLNQTLANVEEASGSQATRLKKHESSIRSQRERISELEQLLSSKEQVLSTLKLQLETCERLKFQTSMQLQKTAKEKQVLSSLNLQLQERRVLIEGEKQKGIGILVKDKDILSRANFKLIQLLEIKEQTVKAIIKSMETGDPKIEFPPSAMGADQQIQQLLSVTSREKLLNPRERPKLLSEWLSSKKC